MPVWSRLKIEITSYLMLISLYLDPHLWSKCISDRTNYLPNDSSWQNIIVYKSHTGALSAETKQYHRDFYTKFLVQVQLRQNNQISTFPFFKNGREVKIKKDCAEQNAVMLSYTVHTSPVWNHAPSKLLWTFAIWTCKGSWNNKWYKMDSAKSFSSFNMPVRTSSIIATLSS